MIMRLEMQSLISKRKIEYSYETLKTPKVRVNIIFFQPEDVCEAYIRNMRDNRSNNPASNKIKIY